MAYIAKAESEKLRAKLEKKREMAARLKTEIAELEAAVYQAESSELLAIMKVQGVTASELRKMLQQKKAPGSKTKAAHPELPASDAAQPAAENTASRSIDQIFTEPADPYKSGYASYEQPGQTDHGGWESPAYTPSSSSEGSQWSAPAGTQGQAYGDGSPVHHSDSFLNKTAP